MKKIYFVLIILGLIILTIPIHSFYKKNFLEVNRYYKIPNVESNYYPGAYVFFHSNDKLRQFFEMNESTRTYRENSKNINFDFENYSYLIVYGAKIESIYYSFKTTYFNDPSPSYAKAKRFGKKCVFINYDKASEDEKGVYFYRLRKDTTLRGFDGL